MSGGPALILGASGQDGTLVAQQLRAAGVDVHGTGRTLAEAVPAAWTALGLTHGVVRHSLNPEDAGAVAALIADVRPAQIYCLTGQSSVGKSFAEPDATRQSHVAPLRHIAAAVRMAKIDAHIVYAGSGEVFGATTRAAPATEASPFRPASPYAAAKVEAVELARALNARGDARISVAHLFGHESPIRRGDFVFGKVLAAIAAIRAGPSGHARAPLTLGNGAVVRDWGWAPDYAAAMIRMTARAEPAELVLATGTSVSLTDAVGALFAAAGLDADAHVIWGDAALARPGEAAEMHADPARARALIGWGGSTPFPALATLLLQRQAA